VAPAVTTIGVVAFATLFVVSGSSKIDRYRSWREFASTLTGVRSAAWAISVCLPLGELGLSLALLGWPRIGLIAAAILLFALAFGSVIAYYRVGPVQCNCFGASSSHRLGWGVAARNAVLAVLAMALSLLTDSAGDVSRWKFALVVAIFAVTAVAASEYVTMRERFLPPTGRVEGRG